MLTDDFTVLDPRFRKLVFGNVRVDKLWTGGRWTEGPAYFPAGKYLVWSDIPNDRVMRYDETGRQHLGLHRPRDEPQRPYGRPRGPADLLRTPGDAASRASSTTAAAPVLVADRRRPAAQLAQRRLVVKSDGTIWFSDPTYGIGQRIRGRLSGAGSRPPATCTGTIRATARRRR